MGRGYKYVGPPQIAKTADRHSGTKIDSVATLQQFLAGQQCAGHPTTFTFVVRLDGWLYLAERQTEHVRCASGESVLSAGEMTLETRTGNPGNGPCVVDVTNQSTGYCPEAVSWEMVSKALARIPVPHPSGFDSAFVFRRCEACGQINIVKDDWFFCDVCNSNLPASWNLAEPWD